MPKLHVANTFFEWELELQTKIELSQAFAQSPIFRQLQFLPILYASDDDGILVSDLPDTQISRPKLYTLSDTHFDELYEIESWGASRLIAAFAHKHDLQYAMPNWEVVREVNSKRFSFECAPKLPLATLLTDEAQAQKWLTSFEGKKILKTCYGLSGSGHLIIDSPSFPKEKIRAFLQREWNKQLPVIAEPFVSRILDFSTQWEISQDRGITYIGATLCANDDRGQYLYNTVGDEKALFKEHLSHLKQHQQMVQPILTQMAELGFFGNVGIDAMLYTLDADLFLHPVVEINARKTMGWAALAFQRKQHPDKLIRFSFIKSSDGALPSSIVLKDGKNFPFRRNLTIDF